MSADARSLVEQIVRTRDELSEALSDPDLSHDRERYAAVNKRWSELAEAFALATEWEDAQARSAEAREMLAEDETTRTCARCSTRRSPSSRGWRRASARR